jgi:hypothetical protein
MWLYFEKERRKDHRNMMAKRSPGNEMLFGYHQGTERHCALVRVEWTKPPYSYCFPSAATRNLPQTEHSHLVDKSTSHERRWLRELLRWADPFLVAQWHKCLLLYPGKRQHRPACATGLKKKPDIRIMQQKNKRKKRKIGLILEMPTSKDTSSGVCEQTKQKPCPHR